MITRDVHTIDELHEEDIDNLSGTAYCRTSTVLSSKNTTCTKRACQHPRPRTRHPKVHQAVKDLLELPLHDHRDVTTSPWSIPVLISSPMWDGLDSGSSSDPECEPNFALFFRTGKSSKNQCKSLICIVTQTTR